MSNGVHVNDRKELVIPLESAALVFIQMQDERSPTIYQDGEKLRGVTSIVIRAAANELTTHQVEFITGATSKKG